jgi:hypothetical protein
MMLFNRFAVFGLTDFSKIMLAFFRKTCIITFATEGH